MKEFIDFIEYMKNGGFGRSLKERREQEEKGEVLRDTIDNYIIDSCWTFDAGYETAIWTKEKTHIVIVEYYKTKEEMIKGHKKWCKKATKKPKMVYSVVNKQKEEI